MTKNLLQLWSLFWLREAHPHALALFRIAFGGFLLFYWSLKIPELPLFSSHQGIILPWYDLDPPAWQHLLLTPPPPWAAWIVFAVLMIALFCLAIGFGARVAAALALLLSVYYWHLSIHLFGTSFDRLFMFTLLVLACSGCDRTLSVAMWRKRDSVFAWEPVSILPQRLLAVQISATYLGVGWQKIVLPAWQGGEVLTYGLIGPWATAPAYWLARQNLPLWIFDVLNWCIKLFECTIPFGLWSRTYRWWYIAGGALFHVYIAIFLAIWWFLVLVPAYIVFFSPEEVYKTFLRMLKKKDLLSPAFR